MINPMAKMLNQKLINSNPQVQQALEYVRQNGGDPKEAFYKLARESGINPEDILNQIK